MAVSSAVNRQKATNPNVPVFFGKKSEHEKRILVATFIAFLAQGLKEIEIMEQMNLRDLKALTEVKRWMYEYEAKETTDKSNIELFIDYCVAQRGCVSVLEEIIRTYKTNNQSNAIVGAVRAKSDIIDKIIKRGEELGVLRKDKSSRIIAGIDIRGMTNIDIAIRVRTELKQLEQLTGGQIIDVTPEDAGLVIQRQKVLDS